VLAALDDAIAARRTRSGKTEDTAGS